jgi:hypothetical protein
VLTIQLWLLRQQTAAQENNAEQNVDKVIYLRKLERTYMPHFVRASAKDKQTQESQRQVDKAENKTEPLGARQRSGKAKVESDRSGDDVDNIVRWCQMRAEQVGRKESTDSHQKKNDAENLANSLCHDLCLISSIKG